MILKTDITGLILAGGAGRRMGGIDKGWVEYQDKPLIEWAIAALAPQVGTIIISANRNIERYAALGYPVVQDSSDNYQGPLAGILAGLEACTTPWLQVTPCDTPHFPDDLVQQLSAVIEETQSKAYVPFAEQREQWVFTLFSTDALPDLRSAFDQGERTLGKIISGLPAMPVQAKDSSHQAFRNINGPTDAVD